MAETPEAVMLRAAGTAVLIDITGPELPRVLHWGADPGDVPADRLAADLTSAMPFSAFDSWWPLTLLPGEADGWSGRPGLAGHRGGADAFPRLAVRERPVLEREEDGAASLVVTAADPQSGLATRSELRLEACGVLRIRHTLTNTGATDYTVAALRAVLPVPAEAGEVLDLTGRWCRERSPQRRPFGQGAWVRESRRGRTGHDATLLLVAGTPGFGFRSGQVWAVHVAWSGNHECLAERLPEGAGAGGEGVLGGGELLLPGEVRLAPGESYSSPWLAFAWSDAGLDGLSARMHRWLRSRPGHPGRPRPLVLNTWEAVYFDHDLDRLTELAERAARVGVERFVLDDGWFHGRQGESGGLGDWWIDEQLWPQGLRPLADRVRALGMEFGLWVEPEMVSPASELARTHPDWVLAAPHRRPRLWRSQWVLDVAHPDAAAYLVDRLDAVIGEAGAGYLKWDHNRDLHESVHIGPDGVAGAGVHAQTLAVYALMDELRRRRPGLEIEACASGGGRIDLGILERTDRVWASDTNDPLERQAIQRWTGLLVPPELVGTHVGPPFAATTGRYADLGFRCLTALFGHAGIEWNLIDCDEEELERLATWADAYKQLRGLLHSGEVVRADHPDRGAWLHGVVAADRREAVFCYVRLATSPEAQPGRLRFPGLDPEVEYLVRPRDDAGGARVLWSRPPSWWASGGCRATGAVLERVGLPAPMLAPSQAALVHLTAG